jgi:hypothetical protein
MLAQQRKENLLTLDVLAAAFDMRLAEHVRKKNPFATDGNQLPAMPPASQAPTSDSQERLSASDVLKAR